MIFVVLIILICTLNCTIIQIYNLFATTDTKKPHRREVFTIQQQVKSDAFNYVMFKNLYVIFKLLNGAYHVTL